MKSISSLLYYEILQHIPMWPMPRYKLGYSPRRWAVKYILENRCNKDVTVKDHCYFGNGSRLTVDDRSQMGQNVRFAGTITLGNDIVMGPNDVMKATNHEFARTDIPINQQGAKPEGSNTIGNDCRIGSHAIILPSVTLGDQCIVSAGAVATNSFPENLMFLRGRLYENYFIPLRESRICIHARTGRIKESRLGVLGRPGGYRLIKKYVKFSLQ